jgi:nucleotide-binding universal stress UspA family protein
MPDVNRILYATDLSTHSIYALQFALKSALLNGAEMVVLHVFDRVHPSFNPVLDLYVTGAEQKKYMTSE